MTNIPHWASNDDHAAGGDPWSSQPNKVEPSAGKLRTGRLPEERPPAEHTNWWRNEVTKALASMRVSNFLTQADVTGITFLASWVPRSSCYDPTDETTIIGDSGGPVTNSAKTGDSGLHFVDDDDTTVGIAQGISANGGMGVDTNDNGRRVAVCGLNPDAIYFSTRPTNWTPSMLGTPLLNWSQVAGNTQSTPNWYFMIGAETGEIYGSSDGGATFSQLTTGLTLSPILGLCHSKDSQDLWMVITATQIATSTDNGANWNVAAHGLSVTPRYGSMQLVHDPLYRRWVLALAGNSVAVSNDNGTTWSTTNNIWDTAPASNERSLLCSREGEVVAVADVTPAYISASIDGGLTWRWKDSPLAYGGVVGHPIPVYHDGRFSLLSRVSAGVTAIAGVGL